MSSESKSLILIDQSVLVDAAWDSCQQAFQAIERLKKDLARYEAGDLPAYNRWYNSTFGAYLSLIREFSATIDSRERSLADARKQHWTRFFGPTGAIPGGPAQFRAEPGTRQEYDESGWREVEAEELDAGDEEEEEQGEEYRFEQARFHDDELDFNYEEDEEFVRSFEARFRQYSWTSDQYRSRGAWNEGGDDRSKRESHRGSAPKPETPREIERNERLRGRYRALVKRLHPDLNSGLSEEEKGLWHRVQGAYREGNLEELDLLIALSETLSGARSRAHGASLDQLRKASDEMAKLLVPLQRKLEEARQNRAWRFTELQDRQPLRRKIEAELQSSLLKLRQQLAVLEAQIQRFHRTADVAASYEERV